MALFSLEHSAAAYWFDFALYSAVCAVMACLLIFASPAGTGPALAWWVLAGGALWSLLEYVLHRYVLHGVAPFSRWHSEHHQRPHALISSPMLLSLSLFALLAALPAVALLGLWPGLAFTLGLVAGYLAYGLTHHAVHHRMPPWLARNAWLGRRRIRHAMHHYHHRTGGAVRADTECHYGVSNSFWDAVFRTNPQVKTP